MVVGDSGKGRGADWASASLAESRADPRDLLFGGRSRPALSRMMLDALEAALLVAPDPAQLVRASSGRRASAALRDNSATSVAGSAAP
jgi:hypothetical protein